MRNRILAFFLILIIFVSMIPINVYAASTEKIKGNNLEWEMTTKKGSTYKIEYWHPKGYDKIKIYNVSGSSNVRTYHFIYYNNQTEFTQPNTITNSSVFRREAVGASYGNPNFEYLEKNTGYLLFNPEQSTYYTIDFTKYTAGEGETIQYIPNNITENGYYLSSDDEEFETYYANWYYGEYGFYPPLASEVEDEIEFMEGNYYAILMQESIIAGSGIDLETGKTKSYGFVETAEYIELPTKTVTSIDGKARGLTYVVISSHNTEGDIINTSIADNGLIDYIVGAAGSLGVWLDSGMRRNDYNIINHMFYNNKANLNRYYFSTLQDACKFVLYGTAGAKYDYKEIGAVDYGYGYVSVEYNNYDITGYPTKKIPEENYPLGRQEIILTRHDIKGEGKPYIYIDLNYYSRVSMIDPDYKLIVNNKYTQPIYLTYTQGAEEFNPLDKTQYKVDPTLAIPKTQTYQLYYKGMPDTSNTWDIIYSTYGLYQVKEGTILDGEAKSEQIIQVWTDENGNVSIENIASGEAFINGNPDAYVKNEEGEYINSDGDRWDKENYKNEIKDWQSTLKEYQNKIELLADIIEDFTIFLNSSKDQIGEITGLLNAVMLSIPSIFRTLILMSVMALVFSRIIKRGD